MRVVGKFWVSEKMISLLLSYQGWSCPQCENISSLLMEEEMIELVEAFDKLDENLDTQVTMDEFLKYQVTTD